MSPAPEQAKQNREESCQPGEQPAKVANVGGGDEDCEKAYQQHLDEIRSFKPVSSFYNYVN